MAGPVTKSTILTTLLLLLQLFSPVHSQSSSRGGQTISCVMPSGVRGNCVKANLCTEMVQYLETHPMDAHQYLQQRHCGFSDGVPMMCCSVTTPPEQFLPHECGRDLSQRIVGGTRVDIREYPWMALLEYQQPRGTSTSCGGSLISKRYVITAAHCVRMQSFPRGWRLTGVRLGEYDTTTERDCVPEGNGKQLCADPTVTVGIEETFIHEGYQPNSRSQPNDIALIRLSENVNFTDYIKPICLPASSSTIDGRAVVAGWGATESGFDSTVKLQVRVPLVSHAECKPKYKRSAINLIDSQICAGGQRDRDSCRGDSGGPLMAAHIRNDNELRWTIVGVVSFGPMPCGTAGMPGVYTKVSAFRPWILSKMRA